MTDTGQGPFARFLPAGFYYRKQGQYLESVSSKAVDVHLLVSRQGTELLEGHVKENELLILVSSQGAAETYYLLEGQLECVIDDKTLLFSTGDSFTTEGLNDPVILTALTPVRFLYFSSQPTFHELSESLTKLLSLAVDIELADGCTADHCARIQRLAYATGKELELSQYQLYLLNYGAYLHDIGKVDVPLNILQKESALSDAEWQVMKQHPKFGSEVLKETFLSEAAFIVAQHHERMDGSGYPLGLKGDEIQIESYIVAVVDAFDAMTSDRPYQKARSEEEAMAELWRCADVFYPASVVEAFSRVLKNNVA